MPPPSPFLATGVVWEQWADGCTVRTGLKHIRVMSGGVCFSFGTPDAALEASIGVV
jgi:hypothetical protein